MKNLSTMLILIVNLLFLSCVQKTYNKTVIYTLKIIGMKDIKSVGIRGNDKPLNWDKDYESKVIKKDSLYRAVVTYKTGYKFTEAKFTVNGEFELQNNPNRRIEFSNSDTTFYEATYNSVK